jgi:hypothetical protein
MKRAFLALVLAASAASAWEPATPADVQARVGELEQAWQGKDPAQIAQDKVARARQKKPQWAAKSAWKMELGPLSYYFAVGKASTATATATATTTTTTNATATATVTATQTGRPLDWWYDEFAGVFYTLVVDAR